MYVDNNQNDIYFAKKMKLFALHLKLVKYIQQQREGLMLIRRKIQGITLQNHYDTIHW